MSPRRRFGRLALPGDRRVVAHIGAIALDPPIHVRSSRRNGPQRQHGVPADTVVTIAEIGTLRASVVAAP
ncbi:MAG: hypothetical protein ABJE95_35460 [Byssovorax sp.]